MPPQVAMPTTPRCTYKDSCYAVSKASSLRREKKQTFAKLIYWTMSWIRGWCGMKILNPCDQPFSRNTSHAEHTCSISVSLTFLSMCCPAWSGTDQWLISEHRGWWLQLTAEEMTLLLRVSSLEFPMVLSSTTAEFPSSTSYSWWWYMVPCIIYSCRPIGTIDGCRNLRWWMGGASRLASFTASFWYSVPVPSPSSSVDNIYYRWIGVVLSIQCFTNIISLLDVYS